MRPDCCLAGTRDPDGSDLDIDVELVEPWVGTEPLLRRDWPAPELVDPDTTT
jgi:hypothetical protein